MNDSRKASDVLLSLENKVINLINISVANELNFKLILDRLNTLVNQKTAPVAPSHLLTSDSNDKFKINSPTVITEINNQPSTLSRRNTNKQNESVDSTPTPSSNKNKIPVGQRITDNNGKDLFHADVIITNLATGESLNKLKTNAVGKWQTYLAPGKYSVYVSKITDANTLNKIESLQEIEISPQVKSLQLPVAIIKK